MHAFDVLGDPVRRRILELLAIRDNASGEIVAVIQREFKITQAAVSQHLKVPAKADLPRFAPKARAGSTPWTLDHCKMSTPGCSDFHISGRTA